MHNVKNSKSLTGKVSNIETEVTGLKTSFQDTLKTSLESNSRSLMSQFKDLITDMKTPPQSRSKDRDRGGSSVRSRSPKTQDQDEKQVERKKAIYIRLMMDV